MSYIPVEEIEIFTSALEFLNAFSLNGFSTRFNSQDPDNWVFRGQGSHTFSLIPSALRNEKTRNDSKVVTNDYNAQVSNEIGNIISFLKHADHQGIKLSGDSINLREQISFLEAEKSCLEEGTRIYPSPLWPQKELLPIISIAQHYGIETRLLDWTKNPFTAAYFAATENLFNNRFPDNIVVWALNIKYLYLINHRLIELIEPPTGENPNLAAQQGVFTLFRSEKLIHRFTSDEIKSKEQLPPNVNRWGLEELLKQYGASDSQKEHGQPLLIRFQLINSEVADLLKLLFNIGVSAATLFPGFSGVAKATEESRKLKIFIKEVKQKKLIDSNISSISVQDDNNIGKTSSIRSSISSTSQAKDTDYNNHYIVNGRLNEIEMFILFDELNKASTPPAQKLSIAQLLTNILENLPESSEDYLTLFNKILSVVNDLKNCLYHEIYSILEIVKKLHHLNPTNPYVCLQMGMTYAHIADAEKAVQWYRRTLEAAEEYKKYDICGMACQTLSSIFLNHLNDREKYKEYASRGVSYLSVAIDLNNDKDYEETLKSHLEECCIRINDYKTLKQYGILPIVCEK